MGKRRSQRCVRGAGPDSKGYRKDGWSFSEASGTHHPGVWHMAWRPRGEGDEG